MVGIKKWIRGKMGSKPQGKEKDQQPRHLESLPFLPATSPRPLAPASARGDENQGAERSRDNYGLFSRVPYELRRQILVEAFGERRLHVDLSYSRPLARSAEASGSGSEATRHCGLGSELVPDHSQPEAWRWFGCVCHRRAGYSEEEKRARWDACKSLQSIEPCDDGCLQGSELLCSCRAEQSDGGSAACFVGVLGWLLACRQA